MTDHGGRTVVVTGAVRGIAITPASCGAEIVSIVSIRAHAELAD